MNFEFDIVFIKKKDFAFNQLLNASKVDIYDRVFFKAFFIQNSFRGIVHPPSFLQPNQNVLKQSESLTGLTKNEELDAWLLYFFFHIKAYSFEI